VRFYAFWNLAGKANKIVPIRPLLPAIGLEGARAPRLDPPVSLGADSRDVHASTTPTFTP